MSEFAETEEQEIDGLTYFAADESQAEMVAAAVRARRARLTLEAEQRTNMTEDPHTPTTRIEEDAT